MIWGESYCSDIFRSKVQSISVLHIDWLLRGLSWHFSEDLEMVSVEEVLFSFFCSGEKDLLMTF